MATKVEVRNVRSTGVDVYAVKGTADGLSGLVNDAVKAADKFVTFTQENGKKVSLVAERVEAIWEE